MTPDRTQSNPRLSDALAEQTIAEADDSNRATASDITRLFELGAAMARLTSGTGAFERTLKEVTAIKLRLGAAIEEASYRHGRALIGAAPGSALARFVEATDMMRQGGFDSSCMCTSCVRAKDDYDAARAALLAASEAETMPAPKSADECSPTPVTHGAPTAVDQALARIDSDRYSDFQDAVDALKTAHHSGTPDEAIAAQSEVKRALRALLGGAEGRGYRRATADACRLLDDTIESTDHGLTDAVDALDRFRAKLLDGCHVGAAARGKEGGRGGQGR